MGIEAVNVRLLDMSWFFRDRKNFVAFSIMLQKLPSNVYSSLLLDCLLDQFWKHT